MPRKRPRTAITLSSGPHRTASARSARVPLRLLLLVVFCFSLCVCLVDLARAGSPPAPGEEKPYALIFGTVWTPEGQSVYGVKVKIRRADDKRAKWEVYSNRVGEFAQRVPAGKQDYVVWADLKDFKSSGPNKLQAGNPVTVHIENDERVDIGLHLIK